MNHLTDEELFRLLDGDASAEEQTNYRLHLAQCPACNALYKEFTAIDTQLAALPLETPSVAFTNRLLEKLQPSPPLLSYRGINNLNFLFLAIGLVVLVTAVTLLMVGPIILPAVGKGGHGAGISVDLSFLGAVFQSFVFKMLLLVVNGILALLLIDKLVLQPLFNKQRVGLES